VLSRNAMVMFLHLVSLARAWRACVSFFDNLLGKKCVDFQRRRLCGLLCAAKLGLFKTKLADGSKVLAVAACRMHR